ncbi:MAG TPA: DMT family transporter [Desulfomonilaceae bacterium]|nr:DMT family transporter [Desulfomonilaceae bacterium]
MSLPPFLSDATKGYLYVTIAAVAWASSGTAGKGLFDAGMTPADLVQVRLTLASLLLACGFGIFDPGLFRIRLRDLSYFLFLGGVVMALVQLTYFYAISKIQVVAAILLQYLSPILVAAFSILFWKERLTPAKVGALILALAGCYFVVGGYNLQLLRMNEMGVLGGLASAISYAAYALLGERAMHRYSPWTVVFYAMFFAAVTFHFIHSPFAYVGADYTLSQWAWILYIVLIGTIVPFNLYFHGINYIRSTRAMITATLEPISAGVLAYLFLGENLEILQILGIGMVVIAIALLQLDRERQQLAPHSIRVTREAGRTTR